MKYFLFFSFFFYIYSVFILPFKRIFNETMNKDNIFKLLLNNNVVTNIKIGTPSQSLSLSLKSGVFTLDISSNICPTKAKKFNPLNSNTYLKYEEYDSPYAPEPLTTEADESKDIFIINDKNLTLDFFLYNTTTEYESGVLGIGFRDKSEDFNNYNFIYQIKKLNIIKSYTYTIDYEKKDSGNLIIGEFPHEYNDKIYNNDNLIVINSLFSNDKKNFEIGISTIIFGEQKIEENYYSCDLILENGFIRGTEKLKEYFKNVFLIRQLEKNCFEVKEDEIQTNSINTFYYCNKRINVPNLKFISRDGHIFELNEKDLIYEFKGKYYFLIYFNSLNTKCILGKPLFKKYQLTFDQEKKIISFYSKTNKQKKKFSLSWFLDIIFIIIIFFLSYYIYKYINNKKKKVKANELEENIDYTPENQYIVL